MRTSGRMYFVFAIVIAVSLGLAGSSAAGQKGTWQVTLLEGPSDDAYGTLANDVSDSGYIGGAWFDENGGWHAAAWYEGVAYDLETECGIPSGATQSNVLSINAAGLMAGYAYSDDGVVYDATLWNLKKGTYADIHPEGWDASVAYGTNTSGDAVGYVVESPSLSSPLGFWVHAYAWPKDDRDGFTLPGSYDYLWSQATGVNASGDVAGVGYLAGYRALVWFKRASGGYELVDLHDEAIADAGYAQSEAYEVSETGVVYGIMYSSYLASRIPFMWTEKDGLVELDTDDTGFGIAWKAVAKYVAGGIGDGGTVFTQGLSDKAVVWVKGDLEVVVDEVDDYTAFEASSVSRKGVVVGIGVDGETGALTAFMAVKKK